MFKRPRLCDRHPNLSLRRQAPFRRLRHQPRSNKGRPPPPPRWDCFGTAPTGLTWPAS